MRRKILFISHAASLTGAPILLLNLANMVKQHASDRYEIVFLIRGPGYDLLPKFNEFKCLKATSSNWATILLQKFGIRKSANFYSGRAVREALKDVDLVLSNTITNGELLSLVRKYYAGRIITYIHELRMSAELFATNKDIEYMIKQTETFLVPSEAVRKFIGSQYGVAESKIKKLAYYIPATPVQVKQKHTDEFLVGGAGTLEWRKGPDLFIAVAFQVLKKKPDANIRFIWKGARKGLDLMRVEYDLKLTGLSDKVSFEFIEADLTSFYQSIDVFMLTSREDPYPLVVLEAANACKPTILFDKVGGAPEFISAAGAGFCIDYPDVEKMAEAILVYYSNREQLVSHGNSSFLKFKELHQDNQRLMKEFDGIVGQ